MFLRQNSRRVTICWMGMLVICGRVGSCANLCWTIWMEGSTGTEMKRALTSKDVITSPGSSLLVWICWTKCCAFEVVGDWPTRDLMMQASFFCHPICYGTPTGHYGPEGVQTLCILGRP